MALGWSDDERFAPYYRWKHAENPFGASPAWVAVADGRVVGFRAFLRWELERDGQVVRVVRAVDTATDPTMQRQGIFSRLTGHALEAMAEAGVAFVYNTPNAKSRPGYLKLGWVDVGRVPVAVRPLSLRSMGRIARSALGARGPVRARPSDQGNARVERWSLPSRAGVAAVDLLADKDGVAGLLASQPGSGDRLRTRRSPEFLAWRYGFGPLQYRAVPAGSGAADGFVIVRVRHRGEAVEAAVCEVLVPGADRVLARRALARAARAVDADYLLMAGPGAVVAGFVPVPGQGLALVWRSVTETVAPPLRSWALGLGDIELF